MYSSSQYRYFKNDRMKYFTHDWSRSRSRKVL